VTRNGAPLRYASINFNEDVNGAVNAFGVVRDGLYEVALPKPANYVVSITIEPDHFRYSVRMNLSASGTRDIDIHGSDLRGRVVDAQSGAPAAGAKVTFIGNGVPSSVRTAAADAAGRFVLTEVTDDAGRLSVSLEPYVLANRAIKMAVDAGQDIEVRMERGSDVRFVIVDSVDGTPVPSASVNIGEMPSMTSVRLDSNGIGSAALTPGRQKVRIWANGYIQQTLEITVPVSEVRVPLVKGGVLHVESKQVRWLRLTVRGTSNTVWYGMTGVDDVVPPGDYALEVLTREQRLEKSVSVTIRAGEQLTVPLD
jgi:hypothetical protein